ncbi:group II intron maturase-specific domain-containing protein [Parafrankia sp. Ea1.12]|uniref:group II intron maturase-specific domain-containing protein n=1 Tax=unclassified Parafrankia TaxID=2994368 RepID=UPI000DD4A73F|nr:hypothetical protein E0504_44195 [Parafrankia sp. BMG5.11]
MKPQQARSQAESGFWSPTGWNGYFRHGNSSRQLAAVDRYVHMRLAILSSRKHQQSGRGWGRRHDPSWFSRLGLYRLSGTTRRVTAYA